MERKKVEQHDKALDKASTAVRKPFVKPELTRQARLPDVTNAYVGSFNP